MGRAQLVHAVLDALTRAGAIGSCEECGGTKRDGPLVLFLPEGEEERHCPKCKALIDQVGRPVGWLQSDGSVHLTVVRAAPPDWYYTGSRE